MAVVATGGESGGGRGGMTRSVEVRQQPDPRTAPEVPEPLESFAEARVWLRRPFTEDAVKWKVQSSYGQNAALLVAYIDARLVIERLNAVVPGVWVPTFEPTQKGMWCHLQLGYLPGGEPNVRSDFGTGGHDDAMGLKGMVSDSLKRAAVHFGVGVSVYAVPKIVLATDGTLVERKPSDRGKDKLYLKDAGEKGCRERYASWLEETGRKAFGDPLDHGDVLEAAGMDDDGQGGEAGDAAPVEVPALVVTEAADRLRIECRAAYEVLRKVKGGAQALPPQRFGELLHEASVSEEALAKLKGHLEAKAQELEDPPKGEASGG